MEKIEQLNKKWRQYVDTRNAYFFGDEEINLDDFAELVKDTFEVIKSAKDNYIYKKKMPDDPFDTLGFLELVSLVSRYTLYDNGEDESDDRVFSVTCLVADALVIFSWNIDTCKATYNGTYYVDTYYVDKEMASGDMYIFAGDYWLREDADHDKTYRYNVYDADFSALFELAKEF